MSKVFALAVATCLAVASQSIAQTREDFKLGDFPAFVIKPDSPAQGNPWIAYAPTVGGLPKWKEKGEEAWMFAQYLKAGIAIAGVNSGDLSGNRVQRSGYTALYDELVEKRGYAKSFVFHTRSRGGLLGYNWAADNPGKVAAIGGIYPVTNLLSYPGAKKAANHYGVTEDELAAEGSLHNPIDRLVKLSDENVQLFHIHGDNDRVVPLEKNSQITKERYDALGGEMALKVIEGGGHDFKQHWWTDQDLADFMIEQALASARREPTSDQQ